MALFTKKSKKSSDMAESDPIPVSGKSPSANPKPNKIPAAPVAPDVYTLWLGLSVVALSIAAILLYLTNASYNT
ncbi:MAG: hypothetical protein ACRCUY_03485 [Thermoguttaceae bacterium]